MKYKILIILPITLVSFATSNAIADKSNTPKIQSQKSDKVTQTTQQGHNFNNIVGDINFNVKGISPKQYRDDLNALEEGLKQKHAKTIADLKASHSSDKRQSLEHSRQIQEKELKAIQSKMANLQESYQQHVNNLQQQINGLNEFNYLSSPDVLREAQVALAKGDTSKARVIYTRITQLAKVVDKQAAKAAFNLGKMAEDNIDYRGAYENYKEAAKRAEHNPKYLLKAGDLADTIALYDAAIAIMRPP